MQRLCIHRGNQAVVQHASLRMASPGLLFVVGAGGAGKSSLLATLAGVGKRLGISHSGTVLLDGACIGADPSITAWVPQHLQLDDDLSCGTALATRLGMAIDGVREWLCTNALHEVVPLLEVATASLPRGMKRLLAVLAGLNARADLYLVDEPTSDLEPDQVERVRQRLGDLAQRATMIVATHNRQDCLALGGHTALLAGGTSKECARSERFFAAPATAAGRTYVETGNCNLPREMRLGHTRDGMWWVVPGLLCGMSRPGLMAAAAHQYRALQQNGVSCLVCLEEQCQYPMAPLREYGLSHLHFPVTDMAPPSFAQAVDLCRVAEASIRENRGIAVHCRGGLGRTGTALGAILVWFGDSADVAIAKVRRAHPHAIQSQAQSRFLHEFAERIGGWPRYDPQFATTSNTQPKEN